MPTRRNGPVSSNVRSHKIPPLANHTEYIGAAVSSKDPHRSTVVRVAGLTTLWALPLFTVLAVSAHWSTAFRVPYSTYFRLLWLIGPLLVCALITGAYRASKFIPP